jgi:hypothetical protein
MIPNIQDPSTRACGAPVGMTVWVDKKKGPSCEGPLEFFHRQND